MNVRYEDLYVVDANQRRLAARITPLHEDRFAIVVDANTPSTLYTFGRLADNALWYGTYSGGGWSSPQSLGGNLTSDPSAAVLGSQVIVVAR